MRVNVVLCIWGKGKMVNESGSPKMYMLRKLHYMHVNRNSMVSSTERQGLYISTLQCDQKNCHFASGLRHFLVLFACTNRQEEIATNCLARWR